MRHLITLLLLSCAPTPEPVAPTVLHGRYKLVTTLTAREGACDYLLSPISSHATFESTGELVSPVPGVECVTTYPLHITCTGYGARLEASELSWGTLDGAVIIHGNGFAVGDIFGCRRVAFVFTLSEDE